MRTDEKTKEYTWLLHIAIWVVLFGMPFFSPRPGHPLHGGVDFGRFIPTLVSFLIIFYVNYFFLIKKYLYQKRLGMFILWNVILVAIISLAVHFTHRHLFPMPVNPGRPLRPRTALDSISFIARNTVIYMAIICVAVAVKMTERWYRDEKRRDEMEKAAAEAELTALKSQVNPHFLFNTLNNIYSLIQIDQTKAQEAVHDLSGMLRYVLYESESPIVTLGKEATFLGDYIKLMSMRCPKDVKLEVSLPSEDSGREIAPLLFIPLIENAFKHGISANEPSSIKISLEEDGGYVSCLVENTFFPKDESDRSGSGIGIKNLCRRLEMLYPNAYSFEYGKVRNVYRSNLRINTGNS
ncbi:MAG: histidine kinase [Bacteroidales bacterium]|nr:histidine kinase [Bacteroidales bacterium]